MVRSARIRRRRTTAVLAVAGQGAAASLGQQHIVGGDHHQLTVGKRAGDLAPDRPAGGVPVGRPQSLEGHPLGGGKPAGGWLGPAGRLKSQGVRVGGASWQVFQVAVKRCAWVR
jgi:hypothetical protein